jgi:hypothetical protein
LHRSTRRNGVRAIVVLAVESRRDGEWVDGGSAAWRIAPDRDARSLARSQATAIPASSSPPVNV